MLTLSTDAGVYLQAVLDQPEVPEGAAVRIARDGPALEVKLDQERPGDVAIQHEGRTVLVLQEDAAEMLAEKTLEVTKTDDGAKLSLA